MQHIHILGICGTFMGSLAILAKEQGFRVTGCDANVYPPMSEQLEAEGIELIEGFGEEQLTLKPDTFVIGNAMSRGNPLVEAILDQGLPYCSGPQWLNEQLLQDKWVLAVAGTHGKTSTSSMLAWILEYAGMSPGFLIGGVPKNFSCSARLGETPFFVIEADEYDTAFFDKRSKFVHYRPRTLGINNLEFDHADIFADLAAIETQFHHLLRLVPGNGCVVYPEAMAAIQRVLDRGCWSERQTLSSPDKGWSTRLLEVDGSRFEILHQGETCASVDWPLIGEHNVSNALMAVVMARHVGVTPGIAGEALGKFTGVKRRLECLATVGKASVYDDFAHHPTAIATTIAGLRKKVGPEKIFVLIEPRSNTMRLGVHQQQLVSSCVQADGVLWYIPEEMDWDARAIASQSLVPTGIFTDIDDMVTRVCRHVDESSLPVHIVVMSNGGFDGVHQKIIHKLDA